MRTFTVALLQLHPCATEAEALARGVEACRQAQREGADLALFPEMWNIGYCFPRSDEEAPEWEALAVATSGSFVGAYRALAAELGMAIGITFLEVSRPRPRNSLLVMDRLGRDVLHYSKVHTCDFGDERFCSPGTEFRVAELDTATGPVSIGAMICFDREFPESARVLMLQGAEVVLVPNACELEHNRRSQLECRAFENMTGMALANYASGVGDGRSVAFDGVAFDYDPVQDRAVTRNQVVGEGGAEEAVVLARFDLDTMRDYRSREVWGNAFRKVGAYGLLVKNGL